ncbi:MAG: nucleotidyl transferase AbiEii/AbiGii toxin family protein [Candidatus Zambryskibacteria bacterium]|nr:nucleotidyl transferase AbiEii/AbiGii toxin family protein [Candidatus Zambryskibacteria bacterium]
MFYDILDKERISVLPKLSFLKDRFYLAGGTGLALQLGHRDSVDFDFFTKKSFNTFDLYKELLEIFGQENISKISEENNTLNIILNGKIKLSFFLYPYLLLEPLIKEEFLNIAGIVDIGCMKLSAVVSRAVEKDYIDLYFILKQISLGTLLLKAKEKMPDLDYNLILKSLIYFSDVSTENIIFKHNHEVSFNKVKGFLEEEVKKLY